MNDGSINKSGKKIEISMSSFSGNSGNVSSQLQNSGILQFENQNGINAYGNRNQNSNSIVEDQVEFMTMGISPKIPSTKNINQAGITPEKYNSNEHDKKVAKIKEFKELLHIIGATSTWRWEDAHRILQHDPRARILKTLREQKDAFNEYIKEYKLRFKRELNEKRKHLRDEFIVMLRENKLLSSSSKYYQTAQQFFADPRFSALDEKTREEIFQDYLDDLEKEERDDLQEARNRRVKNLISVFEERKVPIEMTFDECKTAFSDNQMFKNTDENEILIAFSEYMKNAEKIEYEERRIKKKYNERRNRENFRELLSQSFREKAFNLQTKWNEFAAKIVNDNRYLSLVGQPGSTPKELFDDFIQNEKENFKRQKAIIKQLLKDSGKSLKNSISFEEFESMFCENQEYLSLELETRKYMYEYIHSKLKQKEEKNEKNEKNEKKASKLALKFYKFLKQIPFINKTSKYQDFEAQIIQYEQFQAMPVAERKQLFDNYIQNTKEIKAILKEEHIKRKMKKHGRPGRTETTERTGKAGNPEEQDKRKKKHFKIDKDNEKDKDNPYNSLPNNS